MNSDREPTADRLCSNDRSQNDDGEDEVILQVMEKSGLAQVDDMRRVGECVVKGRRGNKSRRRDKNKREVVNDQGRTGQEGQEDGEIVDDGLVVSAEGSSVVIVGGEVEEGRDSKAPFARGTETE